MSKAEKEKAVQNWDRFYESTADFKQRIAKIMREKETGKKYSIVGASPARLVGEVKVL